MIVNVPNATVLQSVFVNLIQLAGRVLIPTGSIWERCIVISPGISAWRSTSAIQLTSRCLVVFHLLVVRHLRLVALRDVLQDALLRGLALLVVVVDVARLVEDVTLAARALAHHRLMYL